MIRQFVILVLVTLIPALELRASIPYGILGNDKFGITPGLMSWPIVVIICIIANIILGWIVFYLMAPCFKLFEHNNFFKTRIEPVLFKKQEKLKPYVEKYGEWGIALFIGIPLPGSGVYSGAVGAYLLGLDKKKFTVANIIGVLIAGTVVTIISLAIQKGINLPWLEWIIKK